MKNKWMLSSLKDWLNDKKGTDKQSLSKNQYLILLLILGIAIMLFSNFLSKNGNEITNSIPTSIENGEEKEVETFGNDSSRHPKTMAEYEEYYEKELKEALENILGVRDVIIVVNVSTSEKKIYEKNTINKRQITDETDANGGKRKVEDYSMEEQLVFIREGDKEIPLVSQTEKPDIEGVLVVAKGAENIQVQKWIKEAVMRTLDVPSHRVSVLAKK
ncbi:stage III sporulation protein AG [Fervidibacillus halotolerans]|uniref:Stage III sporulation protein AG n=1 Tax=Fervidibacillus halotolerans TaxID=2980027 RepID=A0A9E8LYN6_9BACI|nr:stage III sporulation protein AG [Fervidibacillus halotolerans]WAA11426.1 stage III sporulation protein AG [Fervidibacillus halotolerans]